MRIAVVLAAVAVLCALSAAPADAARRSRPTLDPLGTWACVVYGHPAFGDERVLLDFAANGSARIAREQNGEISQWAPLTSWASVDGTMTFTDSRTGRRFEADLSRETLGGSWRAPTLLGGWWCTAADAVPPPIVDGNRPVEILPPLLPSLTATPAYPIQAIREAKQGRGVSCFFVDAQGYIVQPEIIELSDEIFRKPILLALSHSRYQGWDDERTLRPGCRSFIFKLDPLNGAAAVAE